MPRKLTQAEFARAKGLKCPHCGSADLPEPQVSENEKSPFVFNFCNTCGSEWTHVYKLVGFTLDKVEPKD